MTDIHPMRTRRREMGKTQSQIAAMVGVATSYISELERGNREPSLALAAKLSAALDIPLEQFVREDAA